MKRKPITKVSIGPEEIDVPKWLQNMPKTDLHCHLGGSIRPSTLVKLAKEYGIKEYRTPNGMVKFPTYDKEEIKKHIMFKNMVEILGKDKTLDSYLEAFHITESVFVRPEAFERVAYEICEDAFNERVEILELRFAPTNYMRPDLKLPTIIKSTLRGLRRAAQDFGMITGLIISGHRNHPDKIPLAAEMAANFYRRGVVGFDLAGRENGIDHKSYKNALKPVRTSHMPITIHAGEDADANSISDAVSTLRAIRIGHARSLQENINLMDLHDIARFGIEVCLSSNVDTGVVTDYQSHPVEKYFSKNLRLCINTDNRTVSDTSVTREYMLLIHELGFSQPQILKLAKWSIKSAFLLNDYVDSKLSVYDDYVKMISGKCPECHTQYNLLEDFIKEKASKRSGKPRVHRKEGYCSGCDIPLTIEDDPWSNIEDNSREFALINFKR